MTEFVIIELQQFQKGKVYEVPYLLEDESCITRQKNVKGEYTDEFYYNYNTVIEEGTHYRVVTTVPDDYVRFYSEYEDKGFYGLKEERVLFPMLYLEILDTFYIVDQIEVLGGNSLNRTCLEWETNHVGFDWLLDQDLGELCEHIDSKIEKINGLTKNKPIDKNFTFDQIPFYDTFQSPRFKVLCEFVTEYYKCGGWEYEEYDFECYLKKIHS